MGIRVVVDGFVWMDDQPKPRRASGSRKLMTRERYEELQLRIETLERERSAWELERAAWMLAATARFGLVGRAAGVALAALRRRLPV